MIDHFQALDDSYVGIRLIAMKMIDEMFCDMDMVRKPTWNILAYQSIKRAN